ncbi:uncharacterized protein LACBIDRAFT_304745 [Laccaria bicolor S238N-H82]|uniref:Predicted protein n=1 Tax=Laccaria bicolor (strain S238N-H82 / ATCC MYA-4686) TaxID=486041 RepID=B0DM84_LACBS|nr:uncharacterized protein LACBIDRAFT_304745 [Laccaria bicolor S238N-H82]EDR04235.1 predicted protein [Laccaria bicolor S238N-H82]|eukprot:XP_001885126.1 predicted protein [Laccaria bicolor S238N-H82]
MAPDHRLLQHKPQLKDVIVDAITSEVYHVKKRPSEAGRNVLVHTKLNKDVVGEGWNVRTGVQEYGGSAAVIHAGVIYFSHLPDGRIYRISDGNQPEPVTPESLIDTPISSLTPYTPISSVLEDHTDDTPAGIVTSLCIINTKEKSIHPLISGADFYALPKFSPDGTRLAWNQWYHPDMPWEGGQILVGDVSLNADGILAIINETHVAGVKEKIRRYVNPWKYTAGEAAALFPEPVPEDFGRPLWSLNWSPYAVIDAEGTKAIFVAIRDGREILYFVDLLGGSQPLLLESPFIVVNVIRTVSLEKGEFVFNGHALDDEESISRGPVSPSKELRLDFLLKASKTVTFPAGIISIPRPLTLKIPPKDEPLHVVYYPPQKPEYSGSSMEGELPPCVLNAHGGPTGLSNHALEWKKQHFTSRGWGWLDVNYGGSYSACRVQACPLCSAFAFVRFFVYRKHLV